MFFGAFVLASKAGIVAHLNAGLGRMAGVQSTPIFGGAIIAFFLSGTIAVYVTLQSCFAMA
jgi:hypothetical protein